MTRNELERALEEFAAEARRRGRAGPAGDQFRVTAIALRDGPRWRLPGAHYRRIAAVATTAALAV